MNVNARLPGRTRIRIHFDSQSSFCLAIVPNFDRLSVSDTGASKGRLGLVDVCAASEHAYSRVESRVAASRE